MSGPLIFNKNQLVSREVILVNENDNMNRYSIFHLTKRIYPSHSSLSPYFIDKILTEPSQYFNYPSHPSPLSLNGISILIISANFALYFPFIKHYYTLNELHDLINNWLEINPYICISLFNNSSIPTIYHNYYPLYNYIISIYRKYSSTKEFDNYDYQGINSIFVNCPYSY